MNLVPKGFIRRVVEALLLLIAVSWGAHYIAMLLAPLVPMVIGVLALVGVLRLIFGRRWR